MSERPFLSDKRIRILGIGLVLSLIVVAFATAVIPIAYHNVRSADWDQRDYLKIALWIQHGGAFTDSNRNPLYPWLLSPFAQRDISFFTTAKLLSIGLGCIGLVVIYVIAAQYVGAVGGLVVATLMLLNYEYRVASGHVDVEVLLVPLFFAAWHTASAAAQHIVDGDDDVRLGLLSGAICGLTYLAKGTGLILPVLFGFPLIIFLRFKALRSKSAWAFAGAFALVALPLWIHNALNYGSPTYNVITTRCMWLDSWENSYVYDAAELPTFSSYWLTHTPLDAAERLWNGLTLVAPHQWYEAVRLVGFPKTEGVAWLGVVAGGIIFVFVTRELLTKSWRQRGARYLFTAAGLFVFVILFAFYHPIGDAARFMVPWSPVMYTALIVLIVKYLPKGYRCWGKVGLSLICAGVCLMTLLSNASGVPLLRQIRSHDQYANRDTTQFMQTIIKNTVPGDSFILGPTHALAEWMAHDREVLAIPHVRQNWPTFNTWLVEKDIRIIALDRETWERRQALLRPYWTLADAGLVAETLPPGWTLLTPTTYPCDPCLYAFDPAPFVASELAQFQYESVAMLDGYTLEPSSPVVDSPFTLSLYWHLLSDLSEPIHVFIHILDEAGTLVAQHDAALIVPSGISENDVYLAGTYIRDPHWLPPLSPGKYSVRVGLYHWETQIRLTTVNVATSAPDDYPELMQITLKR